MYFHLAGQPTLQKASLTPDEVGAFVFLGLLLVCVVTSGCITWWVNRCWDIRETRRKARLRGTINLGMEETSFGGETGGGTQVEPKQDAIDLSSLPEDEYFGTFVIHIPGSSTLPYCSSLVALSHPQYTIKWPGVILATTTTHCTVMIAVHTVSAIKYHQNYYNIIKLILKTMTVCAKEWEGANEINNTSYCVFKGHERYNSSTAMHRQFESSQGREEVAVPLPLLL